MADRRFDSRRALAARVQFEWTDSPGATTRMEGLVEDLSHSGARLRVASAVPVHSTPVALLVEGAQIPATVRYCERFGREFAVGLEFQPGFEGLIRSENGEAGSYLALRAK